jgi:ABC-type sugar transport system ATPase subunit
MIAVENLAVRAGGFALDGVSLALAAGEYGVLMGQTGAGKTTLLEGLCGLKAVTAGSVRLGGRDVTRLRPADRGIGYVPQDRALFPTLTVYDHLAFALVVRRWGRREIERRALELAELLGLRRLLPRRPEGLSGGEAQRVALGRALAACPAVLLLDEPLSALDEKAREEAQGLLERVQEETRTTTLHVTHSGREAQRLADRLFLLEGGVLREVQPRDLSGVSDEPEAASRPATKADARYHDGRLATVRRRSEGAS